MRKNMKKTISIILITVFLLNRYPTGAFALRPMAYGNHTHEDEISRTANEVKIKWWVKNPREIRLRIEYLLRRFVNPRTLNGKKILSALKNTKILRTKSDSELTQSIGGVIAGALGLREEKECFTAAFESLVYSGDERLLTKIFRSDGEKDNMRKGIEEIKQMSNAEAHEYIKTFLRAKMNWAFIGADGFPNNLRARKARRLYIKNETYKIGHDLGIMIRARFKDDKLAFGFLLSLFRESEGISSRRIDFGTHKQILLSLLPAQGENLRQQLEALISEMDRLLEENGSDKDSVVKQIIFLKDICYAAECKEMLR